ncbi:MAG: cbb3-type cytochrome oxidase assembly protein CcoS [Alphaproteobacteria bacterium]|nr:cbb3-type cytochrome oxidase assembly protein CcoS [Alphaproteobacteria bacterium]
MNVLLFLIPVALLLGLIGLGGFIWSLKSGQFDDLEGAAMRILIDEEEEGETETQDKA